MKWLLLTRPLDTTGCNARYASRCFASLSNSPRGIVGYPCGLFACPPHFARFSRISHLLYIVAGAKPLSKRKIDCRDETRKTNKKPGGVASEPRRGLFVSLTQSQSGQQFCSRNGFCASHYIMAWLVFVLFASHAHAWTIIAPTLMGWQTRRLIVSVNPTGCSVPEATLFDAIDQAIALWNSAPSSGLLIERSSQPSTTTVVSFLGGQATDTPLILCDTAFSATHGTDGHVIPAAVQPPRVNSNSAIAYAGMILNSEVGKRAEISQIPKELLDVIIAHELGHILGLGHSSSPEALMYYDVSDKPKAILTDDDLMGITYLYPRNEFTQAPFGCASVASPQGDPVRAGSWILSHLLLLLLVIPGAVKVSNFSIPFLRCIPTV